MNQRPGNSSSKWETYQLLLMKGILHRLSLVVYHIISRVFTSQVVNLISEPSTVGKPTWRIIPGSRWLVTPMYKPGHLEGVPQPDSLGTYSRRSVVNHWTKPWDDPPSMKYFLFCSGNLLPGTNPPEKKTGFFWCKGLDQLGT